MEALLLLSFLVWYPDRASSDLSNATEDQGSASTVAWLGGWRPTVEASAGPPLYLDSYSCF